MPETVAVGDCVVFVDQRAIPHNALVTAVWGKETYNYPDESGPSLNVVYVSSDPAEQDCYGRQIKRDASSVPHQKSQMAHGYYWMKLGVSVKPGNAP